MYTRISSIVAGIILLICAVGCDDKEMTSPHFENFDMAYSHICELHPELSGWINVYANADSCIFVDIYKESLLFKCRDSIDTIRYVKSASNSVKMCNQQDKALLKTILNKWFGLTEDKTKSLTANEINNCLNANVDDGYIDEINKLKWLNWEDKALSVIYNACSGDAKRHILVTVKDRKIELLREGSFPKCYIDESRFIKIIEGNYHGLSSPKVLDSLLRADDGIMEYESAPYCYTYFNVLTDSIFVGDKEYSVSDNSVKALKDSITTYPTSVFLVSNENSIVRLDNVMPEFFTFLPCEINKEIINADKWESGPEDDAPNGQKPLDWLQISISLCIGLLLGIGVLLIRGARRGNNKVKDVLKMCIDKIIKYTVELIVLYKQENVDDVKVHELVEKIKSICVDFNDDFKDDADLERWLTDYLASVPQAVRKTENEIDPLSGLTADSPIQDILGSFDHKFQTCRSQEYGNIICAADNAKTESDKFKRIVNAQTEVSLVNELAQLRKEYCKLPEINTLYQLYADATAKYDKPYKQIEYILEHVDEYDEGHRKRLSAVQQSFIDRVKSYDLTKKYLKLNDRQCVHEYIADAVSAFYAEGQTVEAAAKFVEKFKLESGNLKNSEQVLGNYPAITNAVSEFEKSIEVLNKKEEFNYWDRLAIVLFSISKCMLPILEAGGNDGSVLKRSEKIIHEVKNDLLLSYIAKYFIRDSKNSEVTDRQFVDVVSYWLKESVVKYNSEVVGNDNQVSIREIPALVQENIEVFKDAIAKIRGYESALPFMNLMWDNFVKDFLEKARDSRDDSYILGQALNIAYHTADFLSHVKGGRDVEYCYNFAFLLHNFSTDQSLCKEFIHNDYTKSTPYSDYIYELADRLGIDHLKILIDKYFIKP